MRYLYLDFEYNRTNEQKLNVLCCAIQIVDPQLPNSNLSFDLRTVNQKLKFTNFMELYEYDPESIILLVSYNVEAEARAFLSLGLDPHRFAWFDLYLEYKMLTNHCDKYAYGKQLIKGKPTFTKKLTKWEIIKEKGDVSNSSKPEHNLGASIYKMLGITIDTEHKNNIRAIIIKGDTNEIDENFQAIIDYCSSDVEHLHNLRQAIVGALLAERIPSDRYYPQAIRRAKYSVSTAIMVSKGYPIDFSSTLCFSNNVESILTECKKDINDRTKSELGFDLFEFRAPKRSNNDKVHTYKKQGNMQQKLIQQFIQNKYPDWPISEKTKLPSLKVEILSRMSGARHTYSNDPIDQLYRYNRLKQSLNGFMPTTDKKKSIWSYVGSDNRIRPYFNIFGSQSSRSQPSATSYIFLKSAWMRYLIQPPAGKMIVGLDYSSEEFLIAGLISNDEEMVKTYQSGDPYLGFAKTSGQAPRTATRATHDLIRMINKTAVLGILYNMGAETLATLISKAIKKKYPVVKAENLIDIFRSTYEDYTSWGWDQRNEYDEKKYIQLSDGWTMFGDNDNWRSVLNIPIQGAGGVVMRESVFESEKEDINVIMTLHDALYAEFDFGDWESVSKFAWAMVKGFSNAMGDGRKMSSRIKKPVQVRLDGNCWGYGLNDLNIDIDCGDGLKVPMKITERYIDGRSKDDFEKFKYYMTTESIF